MVLDIILKALYFFLPAYFANMAPVLFKKIPFGGVPINKKFLGKNKTWRGLVTGTFIGGLVFFIQKWLHAIGFHKFSLIDYNDFSLLLGFLLGLGALLGDMIESYYKRKGGLPEGKPWIPFDQLDFVVGGLVMGFFVYVPPAEIVLFLVLLSPVLHVIVNLIGFYLGIKKNKI